MQRKRRNFSKAELAQEAYQRQGQKFNGYWYPNDLVPLPSGFERYSEMNQRIFAQKNPPSANIVQGWRFMDNEGKQQATEEYVQSLANKHGDTLRNELAYDAPGYGQPDPGMFGDLFQWQNDVYNSIWARDYNDVDRSTFFRLREDWNNNRETYTQAQRYINARELFNFVSKRNDRVFDTPAYKRGKLTETDLYFEDWMFASSDDEDEI